MGRYFERKAPKILNWGWAHGQYADFWSAVHINAGFIFGSFATLSGVPPLTSLTAAIIISIVYEGLEIISGVAEDVQNVLTDIILGVLGTSVALYGLSALSISENTQALLLIVSFLLNMFLVRQGWKNYLERKASNERSRKYVTMAFQGVILLSVIGIVFTGVVWLP